MIAPPKPTTSAVRHDVVIIGGGINGVGVAQAAAAAGHSVLLLEKTALAHGTSSRSSKLIHGGLRYLESFELSLVRECLRERALLLRLAPELVELLPFYIPVYRNTRRRPLYIRAGLSLYALLGGLRPQCLFRSLPRARWGELDGLVTRDLRAVYRYYDAQTDDARLTEAVMGSAQGLGAELEMPARFVGAELTTEGCEVRYLAGEGEAAGIERTCTARVLVNAAGPWVDRVLAAVSPPQRGVPIELVQGAHIVVRGRLERGVYYIESPRDGRAVFFMPRGDNTLVGTTEVRFRGNDPDDVHALRCERVYLTRLTRRYFPHLMADRHADLVDAWAGIRVLPAGSGHAFHRSRETLLAVDREDGAGPPRLLSIYGGKLTSYRTTALKAMERIAAALPSRRPRADTARLPLTPR